MTRTRNSLTSICIAIAFFAAGAIALASPKPTGGSGGRPTGGNPRQPGGESKGSGIKESQKPQGFITKFTPAKPTDPEDVAGTLSIKPIGKDSKTITMVVPREGVDYKVGDLVLDHDAALELIANGMYCSAGWGHPDTGDAKKKSKEKRLTSLTFEIVEVEGTLEEVGTDFITLKVKPLHGDWPDSELDAKVPPGSPVKPMKPRSIKMRVSDRVSKFLNQDGKPGDAGDYQNGQKIEAFFVYSKTKGSGVLTTLRHPFVKENAKDGGRAQTPEEPKKGPRPPAPPKGGRRPGGG
ncbi:MAG: hypothetical protein HZA51_10040 [Planctomycetes bacterium]|nr:hypothetical protein [Planctomycetota bacterium]